MKFTTKATLKTIARNVALIAAFTACGASFNASAFSTEGRTVNDIAEVEVFEVSGIKYTNSVNKDGAWVASTRLYPEGNLICHIGTRQQETGQVVAADAEWCMANFDMIKSNNDSFLAARNRSIEASKKEIQEVKNSVAAFTSCRVQNGVDFMQYGTDNNVSSRREGLDFAGIKELNILREQYNACIIETGYTDEMVKIVELDEREMKLANGCEEYMGGRMVCPSDSVASTVTDVVEVEEVADLVGALVSLW